MSDKCQEVFNILETVHDLLLTIEPLYNNVYKLNPIKHLTEKAYQQIMNLLIIAKPSKIAL